MTPAVIQADPPSTDSVIGAGRKRLDSVLDDHLDGTARDGAARIATHGPTHGVGCPRAGFAMGLMEAQPDS